MEPQRKNLLSFGFVRECCQNNDIDFPPEDIVALFVLWLSFCDQFDENLSHENIEIITRRDDKYGEYQSIAVKHFSRLHSTAICKQIVKKGYKQSWTFRIEDVASITHIIFGIIDNEVAITNENIADFSSRTGGTGLYLKNMGKYFGGYDWSEFLYGKQFNFKANDIITMELDLTQDEGILKFDFSAEMEKDVSFSDLESNIFCDDIDTNKKWRAAVALFRVQGDTVCLLP